jgi:membrane-bound metal-dependent hydrolase YbcI (DUF457 family)
MPNPTTHILIAIILIELFRDLFIKNNRSFPRYYILIAAIGSIIPDLDYVAYYLLFPFGYSISEIHRTFFHSIFIPVILLVIGIILFKFHVKSNWTRKKHIKLSTAFFILAFGCILHLILDGCFGGTILLFYPILTTQFGLNLLSNLPMQIQGSITGVIDFILLAFWIIWMEFRLKISNYF